MKAIILAGGFGKRLNPLTINIPKPLVPICNKPIMEYVVELLKNHGISEIIVLLYHKPKQIKDHFGDGRKFGVKIEYLIPEKDLGTAGCIKYAQEHLDSSFLVISADLMTNFDLSKIIEFHKNSKAKATVTLTRVENPLEYGIVITEKNGLIKHFYEKPSWGEVFSDTINAGIYVLEPEVLSHILPNHEFDFSRDLFPILLKNKEKLFGYVAEGYWKDIGDIAEYLHVHLDILSKKIAVENTGISPKSKLSSSVNIGGEVSIGENTFIADDVNIINSSIGSNTNIGRGCRIFNSVIWDNVEIRSFVNIDSAIICSKTVVSDRTILGENSVVGDACKIESDVAVDAYVKIWPNKVIEEGSHVNTSIIKQKRWSKNIFGAYGVTGECNVQITPFFAARLGSAFGAMIGKGSFVTSSMDGHRSSDMIYRALISGVLSQGVNVSNLENVPIPINRYEIKALNAKGGFHVRKSPFDAQIIDIKFFDENGMDIATSKEKMVERLFWNEDYERLKIDETGEIFFPYSRISGIYKDGLLNYINKEAIKDRRFKIIIDYAYGSAALIFPSILGELNCESVAINAHLDEKKLTKSRDEFDRSLKQLSKIVTSLHADLGIMFDAGGEKIFLVDHEGKIVLSDEALSLFAYLVMQTEKPSRIAVPINATAVVDEINPDGSMKIIRTKTSVRSLMEEAANTQISFLGEPLGGYIFPKFQCAFDAMLSGVKLLELLAASNKTISNIINDLPKKSLFKDYVFCPNSKKGSVIRKIFDEAYLEKKDPILLDGVKIYYGKSWVFVNGHPDKEEIYIIAESSNKEKALELLDAYKSKVGKAVI